MLESRISFRGVSMIVGFFWLLFLVGIGGQVTDPVEAKALRALKQNLIDLSGVLSGWSSGDPCASSWKGVVCFDRPVINGHLHVSELHLLNMNLSGSLPPELSDLAYLRILDVMWNYITGHIPKEIGRMTNLEMLLLSGNKLTGSLPEEIGNLENLVRLQIDQNQISGAIPKSFSNLKNAKHIHLNNNTLTGQIPPELSGLPNLLHLFLDNNNLSGYLPPELSLLTSLLTLQVDNNNFSGTSIPDSYKNLTRILKLSFRNCGLTGPIPDLSDMVNLLFIDFSFNELSGSIPQGHISRNITTIVLSYNKLNGSIPANFSSLPYLQRLLLANNSFSGLVPSFIRSNTTSSDPETLIIDLQNNRLSDITSKFVLHPNFTLRLQGNPVCKYPNLTKICSTQGEDYSSISKKKSSNFCPPQACPSPYEFAPGSSVSCYCALPLLVGYRLKSPGFLDFTPYMDQFEVYLSSNLQVQSFQLDIDSAAWQAGPRLRMYLKIFPVYDNVYFSIFSKSDVLRIQTMFQSWEIPEADIFGPPELLNLTLSGPYNEVISPSGSGLSKIARAGIISGAVVTAALVCALMAWLVFRFYRRKHHAASKVPKTCIKIDGVKDFTYQEMILATKNFDGSSQVGQGGYGKVYKGVLNDGTIVAIKRAQVGSLQGEREFLTEIELLSRLHHKNLVSLIGYCAEEGEQMLVYEFMPNGTLRDHLSGKYEEPLSFALRLRVALGSAKGVLYLHTEANPPIFHRDIKASNILLDSDLTAKVADFGLSRLAPIPDTEGFVPAYVSTVVKGTPGYLDPAYFLTHQLTDKSDVYSLGVVFLEILTGMPAIIHGKNLVKEVHVACSSDMMLEIIDKSMDSYLPNCVEKFMTLALKCCEEETNARPSMAEVVRELEDIWALMPESEAKPLESSSVSPVVYLASSPMTMRNPYNLSDDFNCRYPGSESISTLTPR
ncbi:OLC1v1017377C2 [Oldenlandia corymbosa var. corymbosa]|uniref:non-specific serine/threonine protein kinase n=1 Tax=Oldenlandia corymbosa var. corymbosa TaxID=529605 RepID=A0AAV1E995_OLDCO|nr:OLC1v1017377C2 [Oldenlandia corymbosa var. corymbosa]